MNMLTRGVLRAVTQTTRGFRTLSAELLDDEPDTIQHFEVHGLHSTPQNGAPVLAMQMSGNADHLVALVAGDYRGPAISAGESVVYNDHDWSLRMLETGVSVSDGAVAQLVVTSLGSAGALLRVARDTDLVVASAEFALWVAAVSSLLNGASAGTPVLALGPGVLPPIITLGVVNATTTKVFSA